MALADRLKARAELELDSLISEIPAAASALAPHRFEDLAEAIDRSLPDDTEELMHASGDSSSPVIVHYDLKAVAVAIGGIIGGLGGGLVGVIVAIAGLLALSGARDRLTPGACLLVWLLLQAQEHTLPRKEVQEQFRASALEALGREAEHGEFSSTLVDLARCGILRQEADTVRLVEMCIVTVAEREKGVD